MSSQSHNQDVVFFFPPPTCSASWLCPHCCQALKKFMQICNQYCISFLCRCLHQIISNGCMNILINNLSQKKRKTFYDYFVESVVEQKRWAHFDTRMTYYNYTGSPIWLNKRHKIAIFFLVLWWRSFPPTKHRRWMLKAIVCSKPEMCSV